MTLLSKKILEWGKVLLQLFNKSKFRNGTKMFLQPKFFSIVKFKKLEFSSSLRLVYRQVGWVMWTLFYNFAQINTDTLVKSMCNWLAVGMLCPVRPTTPEPFLP